MENWNKIPNTPAIDALVEKDPIIDTVVVEPVIEEAPSPILESEPKPAHAKPIKEDGLVAVHSSKDFAGISKGYSRVEKDLATSLIKNKNIRLATEEEIKTHLNK
jgi:hypothetical protein